MRNRFDDGNQQASTADLSTMDSVSPSRSNRLARLLLGAGVTVALALAAVACGDYAEETGDGGESSTAMSAAQIGEQLSRTQGCAGCHGQDFDGGAGPGWIGLAGSEILLADGTTVIADDEYLTTAIADPSAQIHEGYNLRMPA
ncbi:MAG TPA: hypothetical protein VK860_09315, partial [Ilumatobacteraceae bacterium]|nr:hypothetical protein [Ilumatobacteraceae bacterium]